MFIVGLTGGIGSGKSVVGNLFRERGIKVVDADRGSREVVKPGMPALARIAAHFGDDFVLADGTLNRPALREKIFNHPDAREWLENLLHPLIRDWIKSELESAPSPYAILESPLLLEMGQNREVDRVLVVDVPEAVQIARATARDSNSEDQIRAIIASQMEREKRLALADDIIDNTGSLDETAEQVAALHERYLELGVRG